MTKGRLKVQLACALFAGVLSFSALAQSYPAKPIRLVVPLAPGGGGDLVARLIAQKISEPLGQTVLVDNRPGGSTIIGTEIVARSPPDGYTLVMATSSHGINPNVYKLPFDPVKDFSGVSFFATSPMMLTLHPSVPAKTVSELIAVAKANPGKLNFGSSGTASIVHLAGELFNLSAGVKTMHIPYKGTGPALIDLLGGQIDMMFASPVPTIPHVKSGRLRAIAMAAAIALYATAASAQSASWRWPPLAPAEAGISRATIIAPALSRATRATVRRQPAHGESARCGYRSSVATFVPRRRMRAGHNGEGECAAGAPAYCTE